MAIHDAGMFTVKGINRLKILQIPPSTGCRRWTPSQLLIIKDWVMCLELCARPRENWTIIAHLNKEMS